VATDSEISRRFNQQDVLENHSLFATLEMMRKDEFDFLRILGKEGRKKVVDIIIELVGPDGRLSVSKRPLLQI
jgi:hypothetical protein